MGCGASKSTEVLGRSLDQQLLDAASAGNLALCHNLFKSGAQVGAKDEKGNTALHCLCTHEVSLQDSNSFQQLCLNFSETDFSEKNHEGLTPFLCAVKFGRLIIIEYLCSTRSNVSLLEKEFDGNSALHLGVLSGKPRVVALLLEKINFPGWLVVTNKNGETPIAIARRLLLESQCASSEKILKAGDLKEYNFQAVSEILELLLQEEPDLGQSSVPGQSNIFSGRRRRVGLARRGKGSQLRDGR